MLLTVETLGIGAIVGSAHASDLSFSSTINLSNDPFVSEIPTITAAGSSVYAVWQNATLTRTDILFRASNDNGSNFGPVINLSKSLTSGVSGNQEIAATSTYVYVAWQDNTTSDIWFTRSSNNGQSFGSPADLSANTGTKAGTSPQIAAAGNNVYVVWQNGASGSTDILFSASTDNGQTFTTSKSPLTSDKAAILPVIATVGSNVYVAWRDNGPAFHHDLVMRTSINNGAGFGSVLNLSNNPSAPITNSLDPELVATGSNVYAIWTRDLITGPDDTVLAASSNSGTRFNNPVPLTNNGNSINPQEAASGNSLYAAWENHSTPGISTILFVASSNNGVSFSTNITLSSGTGFSTQPQVAAAGTNVFVAWVDQYASNNVYLKSSSDNGASFGSVVNISQDTNSRLVTPSLAANGNKVYVAWQDDTGQTDSDILFRTNLSRVNFVLNALQSGWNSTLPPGTTAPCSPSGNKGCNPTLQAYKDKMFVIRIVWKDSAPQDIAIYTNGTTPSIVHPSDNCSSSNTVGCLAKSQPVSSSSTTSLLVFTPSFPPNFTPSGPPYYEYYSQHNPTSMHGRIEVHRSLDVDGDNSGKVDIVDIATIAFAFGSTPGKPTWNVATDLDNSGKIDILDVAFAAFYFGQSL